MIDAGGAAERARPTAQTRVSGSVAEFIQQIPGIVPIKAGYKGTSSFIPPAIAKGKDKRGCNLRQRMLIQSAFVAPKVGRKCALKGGVWYVNNGTKRVTRAKDVAFSPTMSLSDAWGQGASQWTPAQRLAWATQVAKPGPAKRAKAATYQQATQQLIFASDLETASNLASATATAMSDAELYTKFCKRGIATLLFLASNPSMIALCSRSDSDVWSALEVADDLESFCMAFVSRVLNVRSWGLSLSPQELQLLEATSSKCGFSTLYYLLLLASAENGIIPIPQPQAVSTTVDGVTASESVVTLPFRDFHPSRGGLPLGPELFGVAAPVDWGEPGVQTDYLRLWDAGVSWRQMQPSKDGPIDWEKLDLTMAMAEKIGAKVMYVLGDTPAWANGGKSGATPPTDLGDAATFAGQVCSRYKVTNPITSFEVWNEGNLTTFWTGTMEELADLTAKVSAALEACRGGTMVLASSTGTRASNAFVTNYPAYLKALAARDWPVDGFTVHSYPSASGGPVQRAEEIAQFKTLLAQNRAPLKRLLDTELNYGLAGLGEGRRVIDPATGAAYLSQSFIQSVQYGIDSTFWFLWTQADYDKLGIQLNAGTPQTITAWNQTRSWLLNRTMEQCASGQGVTACQMSGGSGNLLLLWTDEGTKQVNLGGLGSRVQQLDGSVSSVPASRVITVGIAPVAVLP